MKDNETKRSPSMEALNDEALDNVTGGTVILAAADDESDPADITADTPVGSLTSLTDTALKKLRGPSIGTSDGSDSSAMF